MQCSNCQFQNMPGIQTCGRCGASLQLATRAIDVYPPRASAAAKRLRRWFPVTLYWSRLCTAVAGTMANWRVFDWPADMPAPGLLLRMIVPGWAQWYAGRLIRARWMFCGFLGLLLPALLFMGTDLGWLLLGLALALHGASVMEIVAARDFDWRQRMIYSGVAIFVLSLFVYYPAALLVAQVASPQRFNVAVPPFAAGDVVLLNPSAYRWRDPQPGDVVQCPGVYAAAYHVRGDRIERILARAGDQVTCVQGKLLVNGEPSPWLPLNPLPLPDKAEITVPENCYLIAPGAFAQRMAISQNLSIVPRAQISGRVYWRTQPLWRFGPIR